MKKHLVYLIFLIVAHSLMAQRSYSTRPYHNNVRALQVHRAGWALSYPVIYLNQNSEAIQISFDILSASEQQLSYTIQHCNADWRPSDLSVNEYLDGFATNYVDRYDYSQTTNVEYVHYQLQVPNASTTLLVSGNYAVLFCDDDTGDTLATACFSVVDQHLSISGAVGGISSGGQSEHMQQVNLRVEHENYTIEAPISESTMIVRQNNSRHRQAELHTPSYIHEGRLIYENIPALAFPGGDEYRHFDGSSIRYAGQGIADIQFFEPFYHINLRPNRCNYHLGYRYDDDINGKFVIRRQESSDEEAAVEADYTIAHFALAMQDPILDGKVYLAGAFTYDLLSKDHQMSYNPERKCYEGDILLKQGYYNYRYYVLDNRTQRLQSAPIERDAYATENDYLVFFYHRPFGERYDHLVGYQVLNSKK